MNLEEAAEEITRSHLVGFYSRQPIEELHSVGFKFVPVDMSVIAKQYQKEIVALARRYAKQANNPTNRIPVRDVLLAEPQENK